MYMCVCIYIYIYIYIYIRFTFYESERKPVNHLVYINKNSNDPKTNFRELPKSSRKRLSDLSSNKEIFQNAAPLYFETLKKCGFNKPLVLKPKTNTSDNTNKKQRKCKIIWFKPPFSLSVKTNIGFLIKKR